MTRYSVDEDSGRPEAPGRLALYLALLALGTALPFAQFLPWLRQHGLDLAKFRDDLFANRISGFFGWDVLVAVPTLIVLVLADRELRPAQRGLAVAGSLLGTSVGLPLYLVLRERNRRVLSAAD
jgi:hypothetical protein